MMSFINGIKKKNPKTKPKTKKQAHRYRELTGGSQRQGAGWGWCVVGELVKGVKRLKKRVAIFMVENLLLIIQLSRQIKFMKE